MLKEPILLQFRHEIAVINGRFFTPLGHSRQIFYVFKQLLKLIDRQDHGCFLTLFVCDVLHIKVFHIKHDFTPSFAAIIR